ncbi:MAG: hypothetical protein WBM40_08560 [Thiohalocapsa sp.]
MASSDSDDGHQAVKKNGKDQLQDRELRVLREDFRAFRKDDKATHDELKAGVAGIDNRIGKYVFAGRVLWALAAASLGSVGTGVISLLGDVSTLKTQAAAITQHDQDLREDFRELREDLRALRTLVQQHQINKREHNYRERD